MNEFMAESLRAIERAESYRELHRQFAQRVHALVNNGGTLSDVRTLADAWKRRATELLQESMGGEEQ